MTKQRSANMTRYLALLLVALIAIGAVNVVASPTHAHARKHQQHHADGVQAVMAGHESARWAQHRRVSSATTIRHAVQTLFGPGTRNATDKLAWDRLAELTDTYGPRPGGSQGLEKSIDWMVELAKKDGFDVYTEEVPIKYWRRGVESATLITDTWTTPLHMDGLGFSAPTPKDGIEAEVFVANGFDDLDHAGAAGQLKGKIVLLNYEWTKYSDGVKYRTTGAKRAEKWGAVAYLVRSVTPFSMRTPHTGNSQTAGIPAAALAVEDANILARIFARDHVAAPRVRLVMQSETGVSMSRNTVVEMRGTERPNDVVLVGGHIDSWDKGVGAQDDGTGFMAAYHALYLLKHRVQVQPAHTLRAVLFTAEETGVQGGDAYYAAHVNDEAKIRVALEVDEGVLTPRGLVLDGTKLDDAAWDMYQGISAMLKEVGVRGWRVERGYAGADVAKWCKHAVCGEWVNDTGDYYFRYHHTPADMMEAVDPVDLEDVASTLAIYALALPHAE
ncbi:hypothetical protein AMAG_13281 [Allomyces macrogynus ATCC 38327]|uniref:Peptide hydrolase n=1 Tax=Allomyces macrogynus (strain ATCC 38327) TaxID=578462 RepID=A0A0L0T0D6_ALLM3|nr:hypothetical protein AMAG_13281 [Allomyces macrogynus ATCC 38327]|eukprot:KNE68110.1 hypothetical protein AMAG_13281 [Allomyces macrogynus ATCC 38327]